MDFKTILRNRRAIRDFQDKEVPLSVLKEIIQDTCLAPTASNNQPCQFVIIQDRQFMQRLSDESKKNLLAVLMQNPDSPFRQYETTLRDDNFNVFYNAPCLVYIVGQNTVRSLDLDVALTAAYFMFSATSRGLGTCWVALGSQIRERKTLDDIGVPANCRIVAPIIVGYPTSIPEVSERHAPHILKVI